MPSKLRFKRNQERKPNPDIMMSEKISKWLADAKYYWKFLKDAVEQQ